jgi:hypothetical protein
VYGVDDPLLQYQWSFYSPPDTTRLPLNTFKTPYPVNTLIVGPNRFEEIGLWTIDLLIIDTFLDTARRKSYLFVHDTIPPQE